ncbi:pilus assembly protein PilP [Ideonella sp.]|uniref:pilus assembly protein PilP n=1 Tax=Ideonella sp. TaxID=1929293 RepID=UPI003BB7D125
MNRKLMGLSGLVLALLAGCGSDIAEIQTWMDEQAKTVKPNVEPISPPRKFEPEPYAGAVGAEPFASGKMVSGTRLDQRGSNTVLSAEMARRKQPLEAYPVDAMKMVGSVVKQSQPHGLIRVEGLLHYVRVGEYLGQNFGKITKITEMSIDLREIVQDSSGEWIERTSSLQLQETGQ